MDGMLVYRGVTCGIKFSGSHLYTWVERGTVTVKCPTQEPTQRPRPGVDPGQLERKPVY